MDELLETHILPNLENEAITPQERDKDLIRGIAYHQAMTSSHGDEELAIMVADLLSSVPTKSWDHQTYRVESVETVDRFKVEYDEASFTTTDANLVDNRMFNNAFGNSVEYDTATLVVFPDTPTLNDVNFDENCADAGRPNIQRCTYRHYF